MGASELRSDLIKILSSIENESLLQALYDFVKQDEQQPEGKFWSTLTDEQKQEIFQAYKETDRDSRVILWKKIRAKYLNVPHEALITKTIDNLTKLPDQKLKSVSDFAEFLLNEIENKSLSEGMQKLVSNSKSYAFLETEEDLYTVKDLKEKYK